MTFSLNTLTDAAPAPSGPRAGLARFAHETALVLGAAALVFWLLALLTHSPADAAFSTSGDGLPVRNWGGRFGAWVAALYGADEGMWTIVWAVLAGYLVGGVIGLLMMIGRGQLHKNLGNVKEILADFKVMAQSGVKAAAQRAQTRRPTWHRLPYGIPLCIGFVGYLSYLYWT